LLFGTAKGDEEKHKQGIPLHMATPYNYILLCLFTICVSIMVAKIASATDKQIVFEGFVLTTAAVIGITIFAVTGFREV
jgi:FtsH-binding integral membrane protein